MSIKSEIAKSHLMKIKVILQTPGVSGEERWEQALNQVEKSMERWAKVVLSHATARRKEQQ